MAKSVLKLGAKKNAMLVIPGSYHLISLQYGLMKQVGSTKYNVEDKAFFMYNYSILTTKCDYIIER